MKLNARRAIRKLRTFLSVYPAVYIPVTRLTKGDFVVRDTTELVIEGYPRSGNSFAEAAFRFSQSRGFELAHHCHAAAHVIRATQLGVPTLVVFREPTEAGRSLVMHHPELFSASDALWEYCVFHEAIVPYVDKFVLASFEAVTTDFGVVIAALNRKFGTDFEIFDHTTENEQKAFGLLDEVSLERGTVGEHGEPYSPNRSDADKQQRELDKQRVKEEFRSPDLDGLRLRAERVFESLSKVQDV